MPGYDVDRFVNISENEKCELSCSICHEIFNNPVVTNCCLQAFCHDCIYDWLINSESCPYDRTRLTVHELQPPLRLVKNLLAKLEIKCSFAGKGCKEVIRLENLEEHEQNCQFNIVMCGRCDCPLRSGHNCFIQLYECKKTLTEEINVLKAEKESLCRANEETIEKLVTQFDELNEQKTKSEENYRQEITHSKTENDSLKQQLIELKDKFDENIKCLKTEKESLLVTIKQLNKSMDKNESLTPLNRTLSTSSMSSEGQNLKDIVIESRKHLKRPKVIECNSKISYEMSHRIVDIVCNELKNSENVFNICKNIVYKMDHEFGTSWSCLVNFKNSAQDYAQCTCYLKIKFGMVIFKIFRSKYLDIHILKRRIRQGKISRQIKVLESYLSNTEKERIEKMIFDAIHRFDTLKDIAIYMQNTMESEFDGKWQTMAYSFGDESVHKKKDKFIRFEIGELKIILFQTE